MYFGPPYYGYALNFLFVYFVIPGTRPFLSESKSYLFYLNAISINEIHICSNKHETGLVGHILSIFDLVLLTPMP